MLALVATRLGCSAARAALPAASSSAPTATPTALLRRCRGARLTPLLPTMQGVPMEQAAVLRAMATGGGVGAPAGAPVSINDRIISDHQRLDSYIRQLSEGSKTHEEREHLRHMIVHDLSVHSLAEEEVLYPQLKKAFGKELRDHVLDEHTHLKHILKDIDGMTTNDPAFMTRLGDLQKELAHHVREEEENVLPHFASRMDAAELGRLGDKFEETKHKVPTRPHILAPDKPITGNVVADRMTAPLDKMRDRLGGREVE